MAFSNIGPDAPGAGNSLFMHGTQSLHGTQFLHGILA